MILTIALAAFAQPILVGIDESPPFAYQKDGKWSGISVELWESIANENHWQYQYVVKPFPELLIDLSNDQLDIALPAITITAEREQLFDFTYPYMIEDVAIATNKTDSFWTVSLEVMHKLSKPMVYLLGSLVVAGGFYHFFEKRNSGGRGFLDSMYWALTTMTTVGYGDEAPKVLSGRIFSMFWMFSALFIFAFINAQMIGIFSSINWVANIDDLSDLRNEDVVTVKGTFSDSLLDQKQIKHRTVEKESDLITALNKPGFIVYDRSILSYYFNNDSSVSILENGYYHQYLAFAVRDGYPLLEELNYDLLSTTNTEWWQTVIFTNTQKGE